MRFNKNNLEALEKEESFERIERIRLMVCNKTSEQQLDWRHVPKWDEYVREFDTVKSRYPFFVMEGRTQTAKTCWASDRLGYKKKVFYVNAAYGNEPDLRKYDYFRQRIILYDEASPEMVIAQKLLFQAPPVWVKLGQSQTNCHSYDVFVSGVMMIICSNTWAADLKKMSDEDRNWLEGNSYYHNTGCQPLYHLESYDHFM